MIDEESAKASLDAFDEIDDVQDVYTNANISDEILDNLNGG